MLFYLQFPLSLRNVEDLHFELAIAILHATARLWWNRFGPLFAADIRRQQFSRMEGVSQRRWQLDDVFIKIYGERPYLWRDLDHEGRVLEGFVTTKRDKAAALMFLKNALQLHGKAEGIGTDWLRPNPATIGELGNPDRREMDRLLKR